MSQPARMTLRKVLSVLQYRRIMILRVDRVPCAELNALHAEFLAQRMSAVRMLGICLPVILE